MSEQAKMSFLEKLEYLMKRDNVSRSDLSNATGISRSTIDNWFSRDNMEPKKDLILAIAEFFHVSLYYLIKDECLEDPAPSKNNPFAQYLSDGEVLAFHLDDGITASDLTKEEIDEVINFIKYIRSKREGSKD